MLLKLILNQVLGAFNIFLLFNSEDIIVQMTVSKYVFQKATRNITEHSMIVKSNELLKLSAIITWSFTVELIINGDSKELPLIVKFKNGLLYRISAIYKNCDLISLNCLFCNLLTFVYPYFSEYVSQRFVNCCYAYLFL